MVHRYTERFPKAVRRIIQESSDYSCSAYRLAADRSGIPYTTLKSVANGERTFPVDLLPRLAQSIGELWGGSWEVEVAQEAVGERLLVTRNPEADQELSCKLSNLPRFASELNGEKVCHQEND